MHRVIGNGLLTYKNSTVSFAILNLKELCSLTTRLVVLDDIF